MQTSAPSASRIKPVLATLVGIPAAAIVLAATNGASAPLVGDGAAALVALWILSSAMCALGISSMRERFGVGRTNVVCMPLGLLATALVLSGTSVGRCSSGQSSMRWAARSRPRSCAPRSSGSER